MDTPICRVAVVGAGYMGTGILQVLAMSQVNCMIVDIDAATTQAAYRACLDLAADYERRAYFPAGAAAAIEQRARAAVSLADAVDGADLVIEAVTERQDIKRALFAQIETLTAAETILASNTSSIPIASLATALRHPERMYGIHWFNPAQFLPSVEVIEGPGAAPKTTNRILELLRRAGRAPVVVADSPGFVANRLQFALFREAALMVEEGLITPERLDEVVCGSFGYRLPFFGPFTIADIAGLDVYAAIFDVLEQSFGERFGCPPGLRARVAAGHLGLKTGRGYAAFTAEQQANIADIRDRAYITMADALTRWREGAEAR